MGWMDDTKQFFDRISCACVPSVTEGFGLLTLEAMSYGKPVICSTGAGSEMCIIEGQSGVKTTPRSPSSIVRGIESIYDANIGEMGEMARLNAELFTWDKIREQYKELYKELME